MQVTVTLEVPDADVGRLRDLFGDVTEAELQTLLQGHARASFNEYLELYLGRRVFSRGSDLLEHRLALLIEHAFGNRVPNEVQIARLFQTTLPAARGHLRSAMSKYRYQLEAAASTSIQTVLAAADRKADRTVTFETFTPGLVDLMNQRLQGNGRQGGDGRRTQVTKVRDSAGSYSATANSYTFLCTAFGAREVA